MAQTKRQKRREQVAQLCERVSQTFRKKKSQEALELRAINRRIEKRKGK